MCTFVVLLNPLTNPSSQAVTKTTVCVNIVSSPRNNLGGGHCSQGTVSMAVEPSPLLLPNTSGRLAGFCIYHVCIIGYGLCRYAGVAVPQVLQQLREFDAPAMQSCKPLPCGTGSCQNRRLREQTLNRKPCHCGSIKGG